MSEGVTHPRSLKVVFYGPSCAGKTANLESLHRVAGTRRGHELLTVKTEKESTLFFDLLPFVLDDVAGGPLELKLYTVPGQVRYDATRRAVLEGADAVVFVADSRPTRRENNIWSLQNLRMNMRDCGMDSDRVPVLFQINRRDAADAASAAEVADWLGLHDAEVTPAVANAGEGVLETLQAVCFALPPQFVAGSAPSAHANLASDLERAFARYHSARRDSVPQTGRATSPIVVHDCDPLQGAIEASLKLGEERSAASARSSRLEREARGFRRLGELLCEVGPSSRPSQLIADLLAVAREVLEADCVSLTRAMSKGALLTRAVVGVDADPLSQSSAGRALLTRLLAADGSSAVVDLSEYSRDPDSRDSGNYGAAIAARFPLDQGHLLVAYSARSTGDFCEDDVHFLESVARHVASGLEKISAQREAETRRDRLERTVLRHDGERRSGRSRRAVDLVRDRLMLGLADEIELPLAALSSSLAATAQKKDGKVSADSRKEMQRSLKLLARHVERIRRLARLSQPMTMARTATPAKTLVECATRLAGHKGLRKVLDPAAGEARVDRDAVVQVLANLIDNAVRFSGDAKSVSLRTSAASLETEEGNRDALAIHVLDRGPGVETPTRERIFAPFTSLAAEEGTGDTTLGIGLYEARCVAHHHGGKVECISRKGGGSEFRLTLPLEPVGEPDAMEVSRG